jgi:cytochrome c5
MRSLGAALLCLLALASAHADTGEAIYKARCSLCHAGGAGGAPKFANRQDWEPRAARGKLALYEIALKGKPNTAMMARGGFRDLSNDEVMAAVDYMVAHAGLHPGLQPEGPQVSPLQSVPPLAAAEVGAAAADDAAVSAQIAEALRAQLAPDARVETRKWMASVGGLGVKVATREGVVWLSGTVRSAEIVERAEAIAKSAGGGRKIENKLIPASIFEWD